jgi:hypothetical protein
MYCGGGHLGFPINIKNINLVEDLPMIIPEQFGFNCPSGLFTISDGKLRASRSWQYQDRQTSQGSWYGSVEMILPETEEECS